MRLWGYHGVNAAQLGSFQLQTLEWCEKKKKCDKNISEPYSERK